MKVFIYDHRTEMPQDSYYYVSCNYWDEENSESQNYAYANSFLPGCDYFSRATDDLSEFSDYALHGNTIKELISFEGISLWWFYEIAMRLDYIRYLQYHDMFDSFFKRTAASSILCDINDFILLAAVKAICLERGITVEANSDKRFSLSSLKCYEEYIHAGLNFLTDLIISRIYDTKKSFPLIIVSYTNYWTRYNVTKEVQKDGIFDNIQKMLEECHLDYIGLEYNNESLLNYVKTRWAKRKHAPGKWIPLSAYATAKSLLQSAKIFKIVNGKLSGMSFSNHKDAFLLKMLKDHIGTSFFLISEILSFINAISLIQPKVILTSCEYCKMGRAAVAVGNKENLPTVALQHGIITPLHEGYIFSKSEGISMNDAVNSRPLPRYTLLYGPGYCDVLINSSTYPRNSLIITGQPRYDYLYEVSQSFDKDRFLDEMKLGRPLIVWISQPGHSRMEDMRSIDSFMNLLNIIPMHLFIKPHPAETDLSAYAPLAQRENVTLSKDVDLYKLLNACDLIITKNSTTAMEAAALNKPIIVLNLGGEPDVIDYVEEGIALGVYSEKELPIAVERLLEDDDLLRGHRDSYVKKYLYKIDGKSSQRVARFIKKLLTD